MFQTLAAAAFFFVFMAPAAHAQAPFRVGLVRVSGMVYNLKKIEDFAGASKAAGDEFALGEGHLTVKNQ